MRNRRISYLGALGLALAVAIPGTASAAGTQSVEAGFLPQFNTQIPIPPPTADIGSKDSKAGTLYTRLFLEGYGDNPDEAAVFDIHAPEELKFNTTKGLSECPPDSIRGQSPESAQQICADSLLGTGSATVFAAGQLLPGQTSLFNGTKQNGNSTVLFHSEIGGVVLVSEMQDSPLDGYGTLFRTPVATTAGGGVPPGIPIVDTDFTLSKKYTDQKLAKKAKRLKKKAKEASGSKAKKLNRKARKLKKKSKKSWVQAKCTDGELKTQINVTYLGNRPAQEDTATQTCT